MAGMLVKKFHVTSVPCYDGMAHLKFWGWNMAANILIVRICRGRQPTRADVWARGYEIFTIKHQHFTICYTCYLTIECSISKVPKVIKIK
jgi:hypothetical protein